MQKNFENIEHILCGFWTRFIPPQPDVLPFIDFFFRVGLSCLDLWIFLIYFLLLLCWLFLTLIQVFFIKMKFFMTLLWQHPRCFLIFFIHKIPLELCMTSSVLLEASTSGFLLFDQVGLGIKRLFCKRAFNLTYFCLFFFVFLRYFTSKFWFLSLF